MHLNPHTILPITCMILALICGIFVITQNPTARLNRIFLGTCITFAAWFSFYIPYNFNYTEQIILTWFRASYCFISFIPIMCFTFVTTYLNAPKNQFWFKVNSLIGLTFAILSISTDWIIKGVSYYPWHPYPYAGIFHPLLILHCFYLSYFSLKFMFNALKDDQLSLKQRNHLKYMIGAIISLTIGAIDFIGNYNVTFYEIGYIPASGYLILSTVAIIKHQLMDIKIVIRRSLIYSILITLITISFLLLVIITEKLSQQFMGYQNFLNSIFLSIIIALLFIPLRNRIQRLVDKIFFKGTQFEIVQENERLKEELTHAAKMKAVAMIASGIAHEIKNPLTAIKTFTEYLPQRKNDDSFIDKYTHIIGQETERINHLVEELLTFAKPSEPKSERIDTSKLINSLIDLISSQATQNNINIVTNLSNNTYIEADPRQLKQALLNITLNAMDAMPNGGTLTIKTDVITSSTKQSFIIEISDTGSGIDPKDLPHIFEPFYTKKENGTGLGLAITQGIIEKHGGKITATSQLNQKSEFKINLPTY